MARYDSINEILCSLETQSITLGNPVSLPAAEFSGVVSCPGPWRQRPARGSKGSKPGEMRASSSQFCF